MSFSRLRHRASFLAVATMLAGAFLVVLYSHAVQKGVLPSPVQPFIVRTPPTSVAPPPMPVPVSARSAAPAPAPSPEHELTPPRPAQLSSAPAESIKERVAQAAAVPKHEPVAAPAEALEVRPAPPQEQPATSPAQPLPKAPTRAPVDQATEALARHWAKSTNARPVVRLHYDAADLVHLLKLGRGLLVARGGSGASTRELYLEDANAAAPLFAPYTPSAAARFSSYALVLDEGPEWTHFTQTLPLYFSEASVELTFVPDDTLATQIFRAVALVSRSLFSGATIPPATTFEGELRMKGDEPQFELQDVRRGTQHLLTEGVTRPD